MKRSAFPFLLALCLLLAACKPAAQPEPNPTPTPTVEASAPAGPEATPEPDLPQRERDWIEDIEFLREEYKTKQADPFSLCPEEEFDWKLDRLAAKVGELSDSDIFYELASIIKSMGHTHTTLWWSGPLPICDRVFPVYMFPLNGKLYLYAYLEGFEQFEPYLLHEVVGVNGVDSLYLMQRAAELHEPFNWHRETDVTQYPTFFDWVGCDYKEGYTFQILNGNQAVESVEVPVLTLKEGQSRPWVYPENWDSLVYAQGGDHTAYYPGKDGGCVQWCIGNMQYLSNIWYHLKEVVKLLEEHPDCGKLAVDLRKCPGGSAELLPFVEEIRQKAEFLKGKQIYVLTGGETASAATRMIAFFKAEFGAVTVGEPTGEFSSFYSRSLEQENHPTILPHSQIMVKISDRWRDSAELLEEMDIAPIYEEYYDEAGRLYPWETCIQPDVYVHQDIERLRQGRDAVLEWVLAQ